MPPPGACAAGEAARGLERRERFLHAVDALRGDSLDEISLPAFARRAGLSERHASRLFQLELGKTFSEHLVELRIERAKALLRGTGMTVIEVAGETGWSSLAHFNAVFRRRAAPRRAASGSARLLPAGAHRP
jgi:transcriptional regulator GlxA family with amidase domain